MTTYRHFTTRRHLALLPWALLAATFAVCYSHLAGNAEAGDAPDDAMRPFGRYTAGQILALSEVPCRSLAPEGGGRLRISADRLLMKSRFGAARRFWDVDCADAAGDHVAHLYWDADTGELLSAGHVASGGAPGRGRHEQGRRGREQGAGLTRSQAVRASRHWLRQLGVARQAKREKEAMEGWRLHGEPGHRGQLWRVCWRSRDRTATLTLDDRSGELLFFAASR